MENKFRNIILILTFVVSSLYAQSVEKITLQMQWKHQFEYAGFYMAQEKGYYKDVGLDLSFVEFTPQTNIIDNVLNHKGYYGTTYANIVTEYLKGKPIVFVANFFKQSPLAIVTTPDIHLPSDLKGKRVMGVGNNINSAMMLIMFKSFNMTSKDFIHLPPSFNINDFIEKKVDAMTIFTTNETYYLNKSETHYNILKPTLYGAEFYDLNLFTSQEELKSHPKRVKKFKEASIKGWKYALKHKDETIELIMKKYNTQHKSKDSFMYEAKQIERVMLPKLYPIGSIDTNRIELMLDSFKNLGFIDANTTIDYKNFIYHENRYNVPLSPKEIAYLNEHPILYVHNESDWAPFNYYENGRAKGYSIDYMNLVAKKIGIKVHYISGHSWNQYIQMLKDNSLDIMLNIVKTSQRENFFSFTKPYKKIINVVVTTKENHRKYTTLKDFNGRVLAVTKGFSEEELLKSLYPNIKLLLVNNTLEGLKAVAFLEADGFINRLGVLDYTIKKYNLNNIEPVFDVKNENFSSNLHIATNKDAKILRDILQKGMDRITQAEKNNLNNTWFRSNKATIDYLFLGKIVALFVLFTIAVLVWNIALKRKVKQELEKNKTQELLLHYYNKQNAMSGVVSNIAHQWKQPLNEISSKIMFFDSKLLLNQEISRDELKNALKSIKESTSFMSKTVDTFNNFYQNIQKEEDFLFSDTLNDIFQIIHSDIETKGVQIYTEIEKDIKLKGNKNHLEQILLTILSNSLKIFHVRNVQSPTINIKAQIKQKRLRITISDNGGGIDGKIDTIFQPSVSNTNKGSGFGLFIAKNIIQEKFFGTIDAKNSNEGAIFTIYLNSL